MKAAVIAVLAVVLAVAAAKDMPSPQPAGKCPPVDGPMPVYLMDIKYRNMFYECNRGHAIRQNCPEGLVFDPRVNVCSKPSTDCKPYGPVGQCPSETDSDKFRYLRDGSNIAVYYYCWKGQQPKKDECRRDEYFDTIVDKCKPLA